MKTGYDSLELERYTVKGMVTVVSQERVPVSITVNREISVAIQLSVLVNSQHWLRFELAL